VARIDRFDVQVTGKVFFVERQNALDSVHLHSSNQPRVVNPDTGNVLRYQELPPFLMDGQTVRQKT
jgi:hypothetical protein